MTWKERFSHQLRDIIFLLLERVVGFWHWIRNVSLNNMSFQPIGVSAGCVADIVFRMLDKIPQTSNGQYFALCKTQRKQLAQHILKCILTITVDMLMEDNPRACNSFTSAVSLPNAKSHIVLLSFTFSDSPCQMCYCVPQMRNEGLSLLLIPVIWYHSPATIHPNVLFKGFVGS